jgi:hypothetical protein
VHESLPRRVGQACTGRTPAGERTPSTTKPRSDSPEAQPPSSSGRPTNTTVVARRLIGAALGIRIPPDKGAADALAAARRELRAKRAQRQADLDAAWDG